MAKVVLFDGTVESLSNWTKRDGSPIEWTVGPNMFKWTYEDGTTQEWQRPGNVLTVGRDDIVSKYTYGDAHIHVEWREPDMPYASGQGKGNSGVYIHGVYELQVLDSYGIENPKNNDCGGIYEMYAPRVNACRPALEWQTYDIYFRAPRFDENGNVIKNAYVTIFQNDILIHNNAELPHPTPGGISDKVSAKGPLLLQDHGNPVSFRNVWIEEL